MALSMIDPRGQAAAAAPMTTPTIASLRGVSVAVLDDSKPRFDVFAAALLDEICARYGAVPGVSYAKPSAGSRAPEEWYEGIAQSAGAAIVGWGDCGSCSTYTFLDAGALVARGVPTVAVISDAFISLISLLARRHNLGHVPLLVLPHPPSVLDDAALTALARERAAETATLLGLDTATVDAAYAAGSAAG